MKRFKHLTLLLLAAVVVFGCSKYDDTELRNDVSDLQSRVEKLETWCTTVNGQISALQGLVTALQANDYVTGVSPVTVNGKTGYTITFSKSGAITIFNGKDGANGADGTNGTNGKDGIDGVTPTISVAKGDDGAYYWTVNGEWLTVDGKKVPTTGAAAQTPSLSIDKEGDTYYWKLNGSWLLATDGTKVPATGAKGDKGDTGASGSQGTAGKDGDSVFKKDGVTVNTNGTVTFTLADGKDTSFTLPMADAMVIFGDLTAIKTAVARDITLALNIKDADYAAIKAEIVNSKGMNAAVATRAAQAPWTVAIKQIPVFGTDGSITTQPIVTVTPPAMDADTDTDAALLKVTIVDKGGKEHSATIVVQYGKVYFPDANFVAALKAAIPGLEVKDGDINPASATNKALIESTDVLTFYDKSIATLQGIEYFTALKTLNCNNNALTSLDVSKNTKLEKLYCSINNITTLVLPDTQTLEGLQCDGNKLTSLDVSKCTGLKTLYCGDNALTSLDASKCTKLTVISCFNNKLTSLDVSKNTALNKLECYGNQLSTLDISMLPSLNLNVFTCGKQADGAGADRTLTLTVTAEQKTQFNKNIANNTGVTLDEKAEGPTWAIGNLVAKADGSGCEIGAPTDGGLYFQFGSLIGWSTTGSPTVVVRPNGFNGKEGWAEGGKIWQGTTGTVPFTVKDSGSDDEKAGIGDPCRYYLGDTWRLPTTDEYEALFKDGGYPSGTWKWENSSATNTTSGLTFPASGFRNGNDGGLSNVGAYGCCQSALPATATLGYNLYFDSSEVRPSSYLKRACGLPVRCVQNASN